MGGLEIQYMSTLVKEGFLLYQWLMTLMPGQKTNVMLDKQHTHAHTRLYTHTITLAAHAQVINNVSGTENTDCWGSWQNRC